MRLPYFLLVQVVFVFGVTTISERVFARVADSTSEIIMRFGGDVLLAHRYEEGVGSDINRAFNDFELFMSDDVSMVNLEVPVTDRGTRRTKPFTFRMKKKFLAALTSGGIDIVNLANNHIFDFGKTGLFDSITLLDSALIDHVGAGRNHDEAHRAVIKNIKGVKIGFLGYYGGRESPAARGNFAGVALRHLSLIQRDIRKLKHDQNVDYIVVNFHWGTENARVPTAAQRAFAHSVVDVGADAIIGHHPHVLQGIEVYKDKVIAYSLGNLVFGGNGRHTYNTGVLEIRLSNRKPLYTFLPVRIDKWKAKAMSGDPARQMLAKVEELSRFFPKSIFN